MAAGEAGLPLPGALWFTAPLTLEALCSGLEQLLGCPPFEYDAEEVWQWAISTLREGAVEVNVSRKHRGGAPLVEEPFHVLLTFEVGRTRAELPGVLEVLGPALALLARAPVHAGRMEHLGEDRYAYAPQRTFPPPAQG
jgi:hypothetical protein